ncbi:MAG: hypothetical protein ACKO96_08640, partial [Flammeovirgaceae bacterium]
AYVGAGIARVVGSSSSIFTVTGPVFPFNTLCFLIRRKNPIHYVLASLASQFKTPLMQWMQTFKILLNFRMRFLDADPTFYYHQSNSNIEMYSDDLLIRFGYLSS